MTELDKINAKLNAMKDAAGEVGGLGTSDAKTLIAALRIALEEFRKVNKESANVYLARKWLQKAEHEIAATLEGEP
jgi:hypothetical protein